MRILWWRSRLSRNSGTTSSSVRKMLDSKYLRRKTSWFVYNEATVKIPRSRTATRRWIIRQQLDDLAMDSPPNILQREARGPESRLRPQGYWPKSDALKLDQMFSKASKAQNTPDKYRPVVENDSTAVGRRVGGRLKSEFNELRKASASRLPRFIGKDGLGGIWGVFGGW